MVTGFLGEKNGKLGVWNRNVPWQIRFEAGSLYVEADDSNVGEARALSQHS